MSGERKRTKEEVATVVQEANRCREIAKDHDRDSRMKAWQGEEYVKGQEELVRLYKLMAEAWEEHLR